MKNTAKKILCITMALLLVLSANSSFVADVVGVRATATTQATPSYWGLPDEEFDIWHDFDDLAQIWDMPFYDEPWDWADEHGVEYDLDQTPETIYISDDGGYVDINSLPISDEPWLEDHELFTFAELFEDLPEYEYYSDIICYYDMTIVDYDINELIMPLSNTTLTISRGAVTSNSVTLNGSISNPGGATITNRGFWIRRDDQASYREVLVSATTNNWGAVITGLTPNSVYHARTIARANGIIVTSVASTFTTPPLQQAAQLDLSHSRWDPPHTATNLPAFVVSNRNWTVSSNVSWLTVTPTSGSNTGQFTARVTANTGTSTRTGTITVAAPGAPSRTVSITQAGLCRNY